MPTLSYVKSVNSAGVPPVRDETWHALQLPLVGLLNSSRPRISESVSVALPARYASYLLSKVEARVFGLVGGQCATDALHRRCAVLMPALVNTAVS